MDSINKKIARELVKIKMKDEKLSILEAVIYCPFCSTTATAFHKSSKNNKFLWNVSKLDVHLQIAHLDHSEYRTSKHIMRQVDQCNESMSAVEHLNENTTHLYNSFTNSDIETSKSQDIYCNKSVHNEVGAESIVGFPDMSAEDFKDQSYSKILKSSRLGNKDFINQSENHAEISTKKLLGKLKSIKHRPI